MCRKLHFSFRFSNTIWKPGKQCGINIHSSSVTVTSSAMDYSQHICDCVNNFSKVSSLSTGVSVDTSLKNVISNIKCCLTDQASVNHLTISLLEKVWHVKFVELYCNLHPLESIRRKTRKFLRDCEKFTATASNVSECLAWRIIVGVNSLRLWLIKSMKAFIKQQGPPLFIITRFCVNRLHIISHPGATYFSI